MDLIQRILDNIEPLYWWSFGAGAFIVLAGPLIARAHYAWRLRQQRRFEQIEGSLLPEERYAASVTVGDPPPGYRWKRDIAALIGLAILMSIPAVLTVFGLPSWYIFAALAALWTLQTIHALWRWIKHPHEPDPDDDNWIGPNELPREAVFGFFAAVTVIAILLLVDRLA